MRRREAFALLAGVAITLPRVARAQQKTMPVIGYLSTGSATPGPNSPFIAAFCQGLSETGYVVGQNLAIQYRWAEGRNDQLAALASDLVRHEVDVIVTSGGPAPARAAKDATSTRPIVFIIGGDPVLDGLVTSFARPGGNVTGITMLASELNTKRLELLAEMVPQTLVIVLLVNPHNPRTDTVIRELLEAARAKGLQLPVLKAGGDDDFETAFASLVQLHAGALVVSSDAFFNSRRQQLVALAARHGVPAIYEWREFAADDGLISYGPSQTSTGHQLGIYVGKVLTGAKPDRSTQRVSNRLPNMADVCPLRKLPRSENDARATASPHRLAVVAREDTDECSVAHRGGDRLRHDGYCCDRSAVGAEAWRAPARLADRQPGQHVDPRRGDSRR